jgi:hypothetical protein
MMIKCMYFINKHVQSIKARRLGPLQETLRSIREAKSDVLDKIGAVVLLTRMMALDESPKLSCSVKYYSTRRTTRMLVHPPRYFMRPYCSIACLYNMWKSIMEQQ